jgi:hypothetical protein
MRFLTSPKWVAASLMAPESVVRQSGIAVIANLLAETKVSRHAGHSEIVQTAVRQVMHHAVRMGTVQPAMGTHHAGHSEIVQTAVRQVMHHAVRMGTVQPAMGTHHAGHSEIVPTVVRQVMHHAVPMGIVQPAMGTHHAGHSEIGRSGVAHRGVDQNAASLSMNALKVAVLSGHRGHPRVTESLSRKRVRALTVRLVQQEHGRADQSPMDRVPPVQKGLHASRRADVAAHHWRHLARAKN